MGRVLLGVFNFSADEVPESIADDRDHVLLVDQDLELLFEVPVVIGLFAWVSDALLNIPYNSLHFNFLRFLRSLHSLHFVRSLRA